MKIIVYQEDWKSYSFIEDPCTSSASLGIEVETAKVEEWKKVCEDYEKVQDELKKLYHENYKAFNRV